MTEFQGFGSEKHSSLEQYLHKWIKDRIWTLKTGHFEDS